MIFRVAVENIIMLGGFFCQKYLVIFHGQLRAVENYIMFIDFCCLVAKNGTPPKVVK
jgi:hypothetical protein